MIYEGFMGVLDESGGCRKICLRKFDRFSAFGGIIRLERKMAHPTNVECAMRLL